MNEKKLFFWYIRIFIAAQMGNCAAASASAETTSKADKFEEDLKKIATECLAEPGMEKGTEVNDERFHQLALQLKDSELAGEIARRSLKVQKKVVPELQKALKKGNLSGKWTTRPKAKLPARVMEKIEKEEKNREKKKSMFVKVLSTDQGVLRKRCLFI